MQTRSMRFATSTVRLRCLCFAVVAITFGFVSGSAVAKYQIPDAAYAAYVDPARDCESIAQLSKWVGALCVAEYAKKSGDDRAYRKAAERAFALYGEAHTKTELTWEPDYARAATATGNGRADVLAAFLQRDIRMELAAKDVAEKIRAADQNVQKLKARAEGGDASAQYELGLLYYNGFVGARKDLLTAASWFRKAADQGYAQAQNDLGFMYAEGRGVSKDDTQAVAWYRRAADQGNAMAEGNLGNMYADGRGVPKDDAQAVAWYRKAADQGDATAQNSLGFMYANGRGVPKDDGQALAWYRKAAEQGDAVAEYNMGARYADGRGTRKDYAEAIAWYRKSAGQGYAPSQLQLGIAYATGHGVPKDDAQAVAWYRMAADQGDAEAQNSVGVAYANGRGAPQDYSEALTWFQKSAAQSHANAEYNLGVLYANGNGVLKDEVQAVEWYRKAAAKGDPGAQSNLGAMYAGGAGGLLQDHAQAANWYRKAALQGSSYGQRNLGWLYAKGEGVPRSVVTAYAWMNLAATGDHPTAAEDRDTFARELTPAQLEQAQRLSREWSVGHDIKVVASPKSALVAPRPGVTAPRIASVVGSNTGGGPYPAQPAKVPGRVSCNTRCMNGDCYRTYDTGQKVHFQAQRKMNAFGEWDWDSGNC